MYNGKSRSKERDFRLSRNPFCAKRLGSPFGGKRSAVAVVNDSPVGCQSRDRAARRRLSRVSVTERVIEYLQSKYSIFLDFLRKSSALSDLASLGHLSQRERQVTFFTSCRMDILRGCPCAVFHGKIHKNNSVVLCIPMKFPFPSPIFVEK